MPVYKAEKYLPQCLDSMLEQTFTDFELLLIDDGSPDRCGEICDGYARRDGRIRVFHQENAGVSVARNVGLQQAKGIYITFVDSDDWVNPDYLLHMYEAMPKQGIGLLIGGALKCRNDGGELGVIRLPDKFLKGNIGEVFSNNGLDRFGFCCSKLFNLEAIRRNGLQFECRVHCMEDLIFMMDYLLLSDYILLCSYVDYYYRMEDVGISLSTCISKFEDDYALFKAYRHRAEKYEDTYRLSDGALTYLKHSVSILIQRTLLSIYKNSYSRKQRVSYLKGLLSHEKEWMEKDFKPDFLADKWGKFLLCNVGAYAFDGYMHFLLAIDFKKMFGKKDKENSIDIIM